MKIKKFNEFTSVNEGARARVAASVKHGDVDPEDIENLEGHTLRVLLQEMKRIVHINHDILVDNLADRAQQGIDKIFKGIEDKYLEAVPQGQYHMGKDDLSQMFIKFINLGYSIGYNYQKFGSDIEWNYSDFFDPFVEDAFEKKSSFDITYKGPDISHHSLLASSFTISQSLNRQNIEYGEEDQGRSEISEIIPQTFRYGYDAAAKMVDAEEEFEYSKWGTTQDRYRELIFNHNRTPDEEEEWDEIKYNKDVIEHGKESADQTKKHMEEFAALSPEEQQARRAKNMARLKGNKKVQKTFKEIEDLLGL